MPITRFLSEPTLRFFMFFLLDKHRDIGFFDSWDFPKRWIGKKIGPFLLTDIVNNNHELEELIQDLEKLGLTEQIIYSSKSSSRECPPASYVHNLEWGNSVFFVEDKKLFQKKWETYINAFKNDQLSAIQNYWAFSSHNGKIFNIFSINYLLTRKSTFSVKVGPEPIRYFEFLWVLQQDGICIINDIQCQDKKVLEQTDMPVGSVLNITLTKKGIKELQSFMQRQNKKEKERSQESEGPARITRGDWTISLAGREACYKGKVSIQLGKMSYALLLLLVENEGRVSFEVAKNKLGYKEGKIKIDSKGKEHKETKDSIRSKIYSLGETIHKNVMDAGKPLGIEANFCISITENEVKIIKSLSS